MSKLSLSSFLDFYSEYISEPSNNKYGMGYEKTVKAINDLEIRRYKLVSNIRDAHKETQEETNFLEFEKYLVRSDALNKAATMEFQKIQGIYDDLLEGIQIIKKVTFKRHGIEI